MKSVNFSINELIHKNMDGFFDLPAPILKMVAKSFYSEFQKELNEFDKVYFTELIKNGESDTGYSDISLYSKSLFALFLQNEGIGNKKIR